MKTSSFTELLGKVSDPLNNGSEGVAPGSQTFLPSFPGGAGGKGSGGNVILRFY
jgi:hypothetical protein